MSDEKQPFMGRGECLEKGPMSREPLRRPTENPPQNKANADSNPNLVNEGTKSPWNLNAKEFVPRSTTVINATHRDVQVLANGDATENESLGQVRTVMYEITTNPGKFDTLAAVLVDALNISIHDADTLKAVADLIFDQAVNEYNFRYNGARLCNHLSNCLTVSFSDGRFRSVLLNRLHQEYDQRNLMIKDRTKLERLRGFTMFLGELFIHLEIRHPSGVIGKVDILGSVIYDMLETLLSDPIKDNVKCVCQMLKFTGAALDDYYRSQDSSKSSVKMDELIELLRKLATDSNLERIIRDMLLNVIELRSSDWGRASSSPVVRDDSVPAFPDPQENGPILYGPDGLPISSEEALFLESNQYLYDNAYGEDEYNELDYLSPNPSLWSTTDGMDEEMAAEFEKFLLENS